MDIVWKYKIELADTGVFEKIEKSRDIAMPEDLKKLIQEANAATPSKCNFMVGTTEKVLGAILSFNENEEDTDTVYTALKVISDKKLMPFAIDPFGNYICYEIATHNILFWDHETDELSFIVNGLEKFLQLLY